jgi:hypothetical protein
MKHGYDHDAVRSNAVIDTVGKSRHERLTHVARSNRIALGMRLDRVEHFLHLGDEFIAEPCTLPFVPTAACSNSAWAIARKARGELMNESGPGPGP